MVRSAAAVLALLILPGFASAQVAGGTHTVVDGDTLWDLAARYYGNPFDWRRIWMANQNQVADPNLILPDWVLVIPGIDADPAPAAPEPEPMPMEPAPTGEEFRTVFYRDTASAGGNGANGVDADYLAVSRDQAYSAPWLIGLEGDPDHIGTIAGPAGREDRIGAVSTFQRVVLHTNRPVRVGEQLQTFSVTHTIEDVGQVVTPSGVVTVSTVDGDEVTAVVARQFRRIATGALLGPVPEYTLDRGQLAQPVSNGDAAMIMGFARGGELLDVGRIAFLDLGSRDGLGLGDEFSIYNQAATGVVDGSLRVVGVSDETAAVRVMTIRDAVFTQGSVVRLTKKMR